MDNPTRQTGLVVQDLDVTLGGKSILSGISFELSAHGITVVMGANGAGKSVLLRVLHGLLPIAGGHIAWSGVAPCPALTRSQALVFQQPVLLRRSVAANVDFILRARTGPDSAKRDAVLENVGLTDKANAPARRLSGGEQQRLALARALVADPAALLLDEPTANLDPHAVKMIERIVLDSAAAGRKVLFVTHDVGQARRLADDVVFLDRGRLSEHSPASTFFRQPKSPAAQAFTAGKLYLEEEHSLA